MNPVADRPVHFVPMWVMLDTGRVHPSYAPRDIHAQLGRGGPVPIASGRGRDAVISIRQRDAMLWAGRLPPTESVRVPEATAVPLDVADGRAGFEGAGALASGDAARPTSAVAKTLSAGSAVGAELLIREMRR